jgi:hypothetical protein
MEKLFKETIASARRAAIEPIISQLKSDNGMDRNHLKGKEGDRMNAILAGCGFNLRKFMRSFLRSFSFGPSVIASCGRTASSPYPSSSTRPETTFSGTINYLQDTLKIEKNKYWAKT